jgi:tetratricopeptide (TPR) repeat protein
MLHPQKKVTKKEIKEDRLVTIYFEARAWVENNKRLVGYIVAAPFIIAAMLFWWHQKTNEWNETAATQLAKIMKYYDSNKYELAINGVPQEGTQGLQAIVDEYGNTISGEIAKLYLANSYYAIANYDKAIDYYEDISIKEKVVAAAAYAGAAASYEMKGDHERAAINYEKAALKNMTIMQAPENLQRSALNYATAGKREKAIELLQMLKKEFPNSSYSRDVDRYIAEYSS